MKILHKSIHYATLSKEQGLSARLLVSAQCIGNDGNPCPLLHGSMSPTLFSEIARDNETNLQMLLLTSHTITWCNYVYFPSEMTPCDEIVARFSKTRYFSSSVKQISVDCSIFFKVPNVDSFIKTHCYRVEEISFRKVVGNLTNRILEDFISFMTKIRVLDLSFSEINAEGLEALSTLTSLRELNLSMCTRICEEDLEDAVTKLPPSLQSINFNSCEQLGDEALIQLSKIPSLRALHFHRCMLIVDDGLKALGNSLLHLERLDISSCAQVTPDGFASLPKTLRFFDTNDCFQISDAHLKEISNLVALEVLNISQCVNIENGLSFLSSLSNLQELNATACGKITPQSLAVLPQLPLLRKVELSLCGQIDDDAMFHISKMKSLQELYLAHCVKITGKGIEHLASSLSSNNTSSLRILVLSGCYKLPDAALAYIARLQSLECLDISMCVLIFDFKPLANLKYLKHLDVGVTSMDRKGLEHLAPLEFLEHLELMRCVSISEEINNNFAGLETLLMRLKYLGITENEGVAKDAVDKIRKRFPTLTVNA